METCSTFLLIILAAAVGALGFSAYCAWQKKKKQKEMINKVTNMVTEKIFKNK